MPSIPLQVYQQPLYKFFTGPKPCTGNHLASCTGPARFRSIDKKNAISVNTKGAEIGIVIFRQYSIYNRSGYCDG